MPSNFLWFMHALVARQLARTPLTVETTPPGPRGVESGSNNAHPEPDPAVNRMTF